MRRERTKRCSRVALIFAYAAIVLLWFMMGIACKAPPRKSPVVTPPPVKKIPRKAGIKIKEPIIRVGLESNLDLVSLKCSTDFQIILQDKGEIIKEGKEDTVYFVPKTGKGLQRFAYAVQIGAFAERVNAERQLEEIKKKCNIFAGLIVEEEEGKYKVKLTGFEKKEDAEKWKKILEDKGYSVWIISERMQIYGGQTTGVQEAGIQFYDDSGGKKGDSSSEIYVFPEDDEERISYKGKPYRGGFIIFLNRDGRLNVINILNLEDYLKGVVPLEMGSYTYSAIEALKAQALAARTYAIRNMGQYKEQGYDICATPACQVYGGASAEDPLTNQAVEETKGEIISYQGIPIVAMYTSTCGGHTEDGENMFNHMHEPYLKGVPCTYEQQKIFSVASKPSLPPVKNKNGNNLTPQLFFLKKLDFIENDKNAKYFEDSIEKKEWNSWLKKLMIYLDMNPSYTLNDTPKNFIEAVLDISHAIKADEKARLLFPSAVNETLMNFSDASIADQEIRKIIAYFISVNYIKPFSDNTLHLYNKPIRYRLLEIIYRILESHRVLSKQTGTVMEVKNNEITLKSGPKSNRYEISKEAMFARSYSGDIAITPDLKLGVGDVVNFWAEKNTIHYIEANWSTQGASSDRSSKYAFWTQFIESEKIAEKVKSIKDIGMPQELKPVKYGVSGRVIELLIKGEKGEVTIKGLNIRMVLGLKENWFTIDKVIGNQPGFLFTGRGWGHGVGLCQVGAYGMALQGSNYKEIIKHFYSGVDISK
ncbi:MAG: hypothetical protein A2Y62_15440 [Candidatus Fischerbacteria bacterium RBG_13_37_8]|uniref:SPOR domain-containing protein n=1 Tax=Candidatus Fischerbacteria bacterium RBG_13_37_8 TaxID=1817863 RepID=A0A1F5VKY0_9BACT|nr:MAG: hypothetical protein A2Y62_15440 [Candidatus Fischerbacteria bacterium RBG_13_37_8]